MKKLICVFVCFVFLATCGFVDELQMSSQTGAGRDGLNAVDCQSDTNCLSDCNMLFINNSSATRKCHLLSSGIVRKVKGTVRALKRGNFNSIKASDLEQLMDLDKNLLVHGARVSKENSKNLLEWVAEDTEIAALLDPEGEVLRAAFEELAPAYGERAFIEGVKQNISRQGYKSFFEVAAVHDNEEAFKKAHEVIKNYCGETTTCIKEAYCASCADIIFGYLNKLDLGKDADRDGFLHKNECGRCE